MSAHWRVCLKPIFAPVLLAVFADGEGARPIAGRLGKDGKQAFVNGYVRIRSRFADFPGLFVLHHIPAHEDRGMMQLVQVVPNKTAVEHYR